MTCRPRPISQFGKFVVVLLDMEPENDLEAKQFDLASSQTPDTADPMFMARAHEILNGYFPGFESSAVVESARFPYRFEVELTFP